VLRLLWRSIHTEAIDSISDTKQRSKEKSYVLRLKRRKNQIETLDPIVGTKQRRNNKSCAETLEEKESNRDIGSLFRLPSQAFMQRH